MRIWGPLIGTIKTSCIHVKVSLFHVLGEFTSCLTLPFTSTKAKTSRCPSYTFLPPALPLGGLFLSHPHTEGISHQTLHHGEPEVLSPIPLALGGHCRETWPLRPSRKHSGTIQDSCFHFVFGIYGFSSFVPSEQYNWKHIQKSALQTFYSILVVSTGRIFRIYDLTNRSPYN